MKSITAILIVTGLMIFGCAHTDEINISGKISSVVIPETVEIKDAKLDSTPHVVLTDPQAILLLEMFLEYHSSDWKTTWHTRMSPSEYLLIHQANGDSFSFGYLSKFLIKYTQDHYRYKEVSQDEIERFKRLLKTIKTSSNQILDPTWTTPVLKAKSISQAGQD